MNQIWMILSWHKGLSVYENHFKLEPPNQTCKLQDFRYISESFDDNFNSRFLLKLCVQISDFEYNKPLIKKQKDWGPPSPLGFLISAVNAHYWINSKVPIFFLSRILFCYSPRIVMEWVILTNYCSQTQMEVFYLRNRNFFFFFSHKLFIALTLTFSE